MTLSEAAAGLWQVALLAWGALAVVLGVWILSIVIEGAWGHITRRRKS